MSLSRTYTHKGFTIVELLIVIVVIAVLAAIVTVAYNGISRQAREASLKSDAESAAKQAEVANVENGKYPTSAAQLNNGQGFTPSSGNTLTYIAKPYGFCVQASNPAVADAFIIRSDTGTVRQGVCNSEVSTYAGTGALGYLDGPAASAQFSCMGGAASDAAGNIYVGSEDSAGVDGKIRKITPAGMVSTVATVVGGGGGYCPRPHIVDSAGFIYFTLSISSNAQLWKASPAGVVTRVAGVNATGMQNGAAATARFYHPSDMEMDSAGNIYVADSTNRLIRIITPAGVVGTYAGTGVNGTADGSLTTAQFRTPEALTIDKTGNLYVGDESRVRKITPSGAVTTIAGSGVWGFADGPAMSAQFAEIDSITIDATGALYVSDTDGTRVRKISDGVVSTLAGDATATTSSGYVDGRDTTARFEYDLEIVTDPKGNVYVVDIANFRVRKITQ